MSKNRWLKLVSSLLAGPIRSWRLPISLVSVAAKPKVRRWRPFWTESWLQQTCEVKELVILLPMRFADCDLLKRRREREKWVKSWWRYWLRIKIAWKMTLLSKIVMFQSKPWSWKGVKEENRVVQMSSSFRLVRAPFEGVIEAGYFAIVAGSHAPHQGLIETPSTLSVLSLPDFQVLLTTNCFLFVCFTKDIASYLRVTWNPLGVALSLGRHMAFV